MSTGSSKFSRRHFIAASSALGLIGVGGLSYLTSTSSKNKTSAEVVKRGLVFGPSQGIDQGKTFNYLAALDLNSSEQRVAHIPMNFMGHGMSFHPFKKHLVVIFEKKGPGACELNLQTGEIRTIISDPKRHFYGHGTYVVDSKTEGSTSLKVLSVETVLATGEGLIIARDAETLKVEGQFPTYGLSPHDCQLIENGTVLAVTNSGANLGQQPLGCVTYVDIFSQKLLEKFEVEDSRFNAGHLAISKNKDLAMVSAPRLGLAKSKSLGAVNYLSQQNGIKKIITMTEPHDIVSRQKGETLSVCINDETNIFAATSPEGNLITFWNIKTGDFVKSIDIHRPRGIVLSKDKKYFLASVGSDASFAYINATTLTLETEKTKSRVGFTGSHLFIL